MEIILTKVTVNQIRSGFEVSGGSNAIELDYMSDWTGGQPIFLDSQIGLVRSEKIMSGKDVADYWSKKVFTSNYKEDYSAKNPFAKARLLYVALTIVDFLKLKSIDIQTMCDFATGEGIFLDYAQQHFPGVKISGTETSECLVSELSLKGFEVNHATLGEAKLKKPVDFGVISWTLCNCIDVIQVLMDIRDNIKDGGYICVADSSRIMVSYRKSLRDYFSSWHPLDVHPFYFSYRSMTALLAVVGFNIVYSNRYFDSDVLCLIAQKGEMPKDDCLIDVDVPSDVGIFMKKWHEASKYFEKLRL